MISRSRPAAHVVVQRIALSIVDSAICASTSLVCHHTERYFRVIYMPRD